MNKLKQKPYERSTDLLNAHLLLLAKYSEDGTRQGHLEPVIENHWL